MASSPPPPPSIIGTATIACPTRSQPFFIMDRFGFPIANQLQQGADFYSHNTKTLTGVPPLLTLIEATTIYNSSPYNYLPIINHSARPQRSLMNNYGGIYEFPSAYPVKNSSLIHATGMTNGCYFFSAMQLLFLITEISVDPINITKARNYVDYINPSAKANQKNAFAAMQYVFGKMIYQPTNPLKVDLIEPGKNVTYFRDAIYHIMLDPSNPQAAVNAQNGLQSDPSEFIIQYLGLLKPNLRSDYYLVPMYYQYRSILSDVTNNLVVNGRRDDIGIVFISNNNTIDNIKDMIDNTYNKYENAIVEDMENSCDMIFSYSFVDFVDLDKPLYMLLLVKHGPGTSKSQHAPKIDVILSFKNHDYNKGVTTPKLDVNFILLGVILHTGASIDSGHYTCLSLDRINNDSGTDAKPGPFGKYFFFHYNDLNVKVTEWNYKFTPTNKYITPAMYQSFQTNSTPYMLLYKRLK